MRSIAGPDNTGWVQYANTFLAPRSFNTSAAFYFTDDIHYFGYIGLWTTLVDNGQVAVQAFGQCTGAYHAADVGRNDQQVVVILGDQVAQQDWRRINIVYRDIEETLDLIGV